MFSFLRKESAPVQLYGKLPLAKDYLRVGCSEGGARFLREWLDHAFSGGAQGSAPRLPYPMRFVLDVGTTPVMGCLWPSSDSGGLRPFPFALFVDRKWKPLAGDLEEGLAHARSIWRRLDEIQGAHARAADGQSFLRAMRAENLDLDQLEPSAPHAIDFDVWLHALFGDEPREGLERTLVGLQRLLPSTPRGPIRLPLVADLPAAPQAHAWWRALRELGLLASGRGQSLFIPLGRSHAHESPFALAFPRALEAGDASWLTSADDGSARGPGDFCAGRPPALAAGAALPEASAPLSDSLRGALLGFRSRRG